MAQQTNTHRINILSQEEIDALFGLPQFTVQEQQHYFALNKLLH